MNTSLKIVTNNHARPVISGFELTEAEAKEFDYMDDVTEGSFVRYKGSVYDLNEFSRVIPHGSQRNHPMDTDNPAFAGWSGYMSESFFSGLLIRYTNGFESVVVARYCS